MDLYDYQRYDKKATNTAAAAEWKSKTENHFTTLTPFGIPKTLVLQQKKTIILL